MDGVDCTDAQGILPSPTDAVTFTKQALDFDNLSTGVYLQLRPPWLNYLPFELRLLCLYECYQLTSS
jgi:hypothetical protein